MNKEGSLFQGSGSTDTAAEYKEPVFRLGAPSSVSEIISFQLSSFQRQPLSFGKWPAIKWFPELAVYLSCGKKRKFIKQTNVMKGTRWTVGQDALNTTAVCQLRQMEVVTTRGRSKDVDTRVIFSDKSENRNGEWKVERLTCYPLNTTADCQRRQTEAVTM